MRREKDHEKIKVMSFQSIIYCDWKLTLDHSTGMEGKDLLIFFCSVFLPIMQIVLILYSQPR